MRKRITEDQKIMINELYLQLGIKKQVAEIMGISPASVTRYLIPNYISQQERVAPPPFDMSKITGPKRYTSYQELMDSCMLSEEEWNEMKEIQKEVLV